MFTRHARGAVTRVLTPVARTLLRAGIGPDVVTLVGTLGVCLGALGFYPRGELLVGTLVVTVFAFADTLDGTMARLSGRPSTWGAFLDSTLDRLADAAIFGGLVLWFAGPGQSPVLAAVALYCLVSGSLVSYARARAEGLGLTANVGIAERAERLVVVLLATGLAGLGVPSVHAIALWALAVAATVTVVQRMMTVRRQAAVPEPADRPTG